MATFLLLHGIPGSAANWQRTAALLRTDHHLVLTPDLLGFGTAPVASEPDGLLASSQADHVLSLLDSAGVESAVVAAHDFGGPVAAHLWARAPARVTALALFATNAFPDAPVPFPLSLVRAPAVGTAVARIVFSLPSLALMVRRGVGHPRHRLALRDYLADHDTVATIFAASLRRLEELYTPVEAALASVTVPALVGWGDHDPFFPLAAGRRTAELVPGAELRLYGGAGHFLPEERADDIAHDLVHLAARTEAATA